MKKCLVCGNEIIKRGSESKKYFETKKYCSWECMGKAYIKPRTLEQIEKEKRIAIKKIRSLKVKNNSILYETLKNIRQRCDNPNILCYKNYGGRGINVCDEWRNNFLVFLKWALDNGWEKGLTIERIDNNGNYEPNNCKWITRKMQLRNKRNNVMITYNGKTKCLTGWAEELGLSFNGLRHRLKNWDDIDKVFNEPRNMSCVRSYRK